MASSSIPYSATEEDLFFPCVRGNFFPGGLPNPEAALCAEFCRLTYCNAQGTLAFDQAKIRGVLTPLGFSDPPMFIESAPHAGLFAGSGFHCLLARHPGRNLAILGFRGTNKQDLQNLIADAFIAPERWEKGGLVHAGFAGALAELRAGLDAVKPSINCRLLITGHSLGAAMATLLASAWHADMKEMALYTFGSPRVGDHAFTETLANVSNFRCVDCTDIVTRVPKPVPLVIGYEDLGPPQYIDRHGNLTANPGDFRIDADRLAADVEYPGKYLRPGNNAVRELSDHAPINYVSGVMGVRAEAMKAGAP